ncbi:MAG: efflux RND transporter periplasmic adaptor subunit [Rhodoferax sp.]|nr:efflux RND transporter periplasmic adaptor subunit [Rhodoferax sp.]
MKPWLKWTALALVVVVVAAGAARAISSRKSQKDTLEAQQAEQKAPAAIELTTTDVWKAQMLTLSQGLPISGPLKATNSAFIKARVAGELQHLLVREGDFVKAGQVIARVDPVESQARARQAQQQAEAAKAQVDIAKRSFDNNSSLVAQGFISKTALESSISSLSAAEANYRAAQASMEVANKALEDTVLRSPMDGQIAQRLAQPGERVSIDARIVEVVDLRHLELEANLSAADSLGVKVGQRAVLSVEGSTAPLHAKVVRINPSAVAGSRAVLVYLALDKNDGLRQGMFAQGTLATATSRSLAVPLQSVRTDKPQPYVQVIADGQVAHLTVQPGNRGDYQGETMVAVQGIAAGALVLQGSVGAVRAGTPATLKQTAPAKP